MEVKLHLVALEFQPVFNELSLAIKLSIGIWFTLNVTVSTNHPCYFELQRCYGHNHAGYGIIKVSRTKAYDFNACDTVKDA